MVKLVVLTFLMVERVMMYNPPKNKIEDPTVSTATTVIADL